MKTYPVDNTVDGISFDVMAILYSRSCFLLKLKYPAIHVKLRVV